jgi:hypothetical protein
MVAESPRLKLSAEQRAQNLDRLDMILKSAFRALGPEGTTVGTPEDTVSMPARTATGGKGE